MATNNASNYQPIQYNTIIGNSSGQIANVAPSATSGVPLISQGAAANPIFGTAVVAGGGTGDVSFTAYAVICGGTTSTNPLQSIASVGSANQILTSNGAGALPTFQAASASGAVTTITGNSGGAINPSAGNINIITANSTVTFAGAGSTETQDFGLTNLMLGDAGSSIAGAVRNVTLGKLAGTAISTATDSVLIGYNAGHAISTALGSVAIGSGALATSTNGLNTVVGQNALNALGTNYSGNAVLGDHCGPLLTTAINNVIIGSASLQQAVNASFNTAVGFNTLQQLAGGAAANYNTAIGWQAGFNYTTTETSNVLLVNQGTLGESNTMRLGTTGSGNAQVNKCYLAGVDGVNVGSVAKVLTMASEQVGTATVTAGTGITVTAGANTITIAATGTTNLTYTGVNHAASPYTVLSTDEYISVDVTAGVVTLKLPNAATTGRVFIIKDKVGLAATSNITVTTVGGAVNIDGVTSYVMNTNYSAIQVVGNGSSYEVF